MQQEINFHIVLPLNHGHKIKHIKDKSCYDHNYYELEEYGDWISFGDKHNNILYEEYNECSNSYEYSFGRFENDKFIKVLGYCTDESELDNVDIEY